MNSSLKLKLNTKSSFDPSTSTPQTPLVTPGGTTKLKLKLGPKSTPSSPAPPPPPEPPKIKKTKAGRSSKPSAKVIESRKRIKEESETDDEGGTINVQQPAPKKIKINIATNGGGGGPLSAVPKTPGGVIIKAKVKGKPPKRPLGEGYDSEASDREIDPAIEEQFILRMIPGKACDYFRWAVTAKKIGIPKSAGGADISMKFFDGFGRRAAIRIQEQFFAATLVDLPCIIEGMKSWDRRAWMKSADICQMLLVFAEIKKEEDAKTIELPPGVDPVTFQYPHGLTAPMHYARKRVFRKRISRSAIEAVEDAVEKLLAADAEAADTKFEMIDPDRHGSQAFSPEGSQEPEYGEEAYSGEEDAEGEDDDDQPQGYFDGHINDGMVEIDNADAIAAELEAEMMAEFEAGTPASTLDAPSMATGETPILQDEVEEDGEEYDSGDESVEEGDEAGLPGAISEIDVEEKNRQKQLDGAREDIQELERQLVQQQTNLSMQNNLLLKRRIEDSIRKIKNELQLKKSSIGEGDDDEDA